MLLPIGAAAKWQARLLKVFGVRCGRRCLIGRSSVLHSPRNLLLGENVSIWSRACIHAYAEIEIGDQFLAADGLCINTGSHDTITLQPYFKSIKIGRRVWCGSNVTICAGVTIGDDVVLGAGSVVVKDIPSSCVAAGVPCRVIRRIDDRPDKVFCGLA